MALEKGLYMLFMVENIHFFLIFFAPFASKHIVFALILYFSILLTFIGDFYGFYAALVWKIQDNFEFMKDYKCSIESC